MKRLALCAVGLGLACVSFAQTFSMKAVTLRVGDLVPRLAAELKLPLEASPSVLDDVLVLQFKDASAKDVLAQISRATYSEWHQDGKVLRLSRSSANLAEAKRVDYQERLKRIQVALDLLAVEQKSIPNWTSKSAVELTAMAAQANANGRVNQTLSKQINSMTPAGRLKMELLPLFGARYLAGIDVGTQRTLSLTPNSMQGKLPPSASTVIAQFMQRYVDYNEALKSVQSQGNGVREDRSEMARSLITMGSTATSIGVGCLMGSEDGKSTEMSGFTLDIRPPKVEAGTDTKPFEPSAITKALIGSLFSTEEPRFVPSYDAKSFVGGKAVAFSTMAPLGKKWKLDPLVQDHILQPDKFEVLGDLAQDLILAGHDGNLIALLPDTIVIPVGYSLLPGQVVTLGQIPRILSTAGLRETEAGGWTQYDPYYPGLALSQRAPRKQLAVFLQAIWKQGYARLDQVSAYALACTTPEVDGELALDLICAVAGSNGSTISRALAAPALLKTYATMSVQQRKVLAQGGSVKLSDLTGIQRNWLISEMMNAPEGPGPVRPANDPAQVESFATERTSLLPNGIPPDAVIQLNSVVTDATMVRSDEDSESAFLSVHQMASLQFQNTGKVANLPFGPQLRLYQPATTEQLTLRVLLLPGVEYSNKYLDQYVLPGTKPGSYDQLGATYRASVAQDYDELVRLFGNGTWKITPNPGSGTVPP